MRRGLLIRLLLCLSCFWSAAVLGADDSVIGAEPRIVALTEGEVICVDGCVKAPNATQDVVNAIAVGIRFKDGAGRELPSGMLPRSEARGDYFFVGAATTPVLFRREVLAPPGAVSAEVEVIRNRAGEFVVEEFSVLNSEWRVDHQHPISFLFKKGVPVVSIQFVLFVAMVLVFYFASPMKVRCWVLLSASIVFYSLFRPAAWYYLGGTTLTVYFGALSVSTGRFRKIVLLSVLFLNLGTLVSVKYICPSIFEGPIWVPLGISFYTLQAIAYLVDVYRGVCPVVRNPFKLLLFLTYFPAIMQGPISRYTQLGDQLWEPHYFSVENLRDGLQLMLWGFFKKIVIADRAAIFVNQVFDGDSTTAGLCVCLAVVLYSIQIYTDFSGCVDISRGLSQCLGIELMQNFKTPYLSESVAEFWRRWHISLSSWLKDYVYIPLGGSRYGAVRKYVNVLIVFGISGIWHGVGLNFFVWGLLHGFYQVVGAVTRRMRERVALRCGMNTTSFSARMERRIVTFTAVSFAWIFFRCTTFDNACQLIRRLFKFNPWSISDGSLLKHGLDFPDWLVLLVAIVVLMVFTIISSRLRIRHALAAQSLWMRWMIALLGLFSVLVFGVYGPGYSANSFIYMQF